MHPIKAVCKSLNLTYKEFASRVRSASGSESPVAAYVAQIVCGAKTPSPDMADAIHRAFPGISREQLLYPADFKRASNG